MASIYYIGLDIFLFTAAGVVAWMILAGPRGSQRYLSLSELMSRINMPPGQKEILREKLVNCGSEGCNGSWSSNLDRPTGEQE
jgi:hypothetical protein